MPRLRRVNPPTANNSAFGGLTQRKFFIAKGNYPFTAVIISAPKISLESISSDEIGGL
jgi:hypothetical protein